MCLAIPGKIVSKEGSAVMVDYDGDTREASIIDGEFEVGDFVIVQGKIVVDKVPAEQVKKWRDFLKDGS